MALGLTNYQQKIIAAAAEGALVLTVNKRLFRHLRDEFDQQMLLQGERVWSTPQIVSYEGWLNQSLSTLGESWRLLSHQQQQCLWEEEIATSSRGSSLELLQLSKTAEKALQAHHLLNHYGLTLENQNLTEDQKVFYSWQKHYQERCRQQGWLDQSDLPGRIHTALIKGQIKVPGQVMLLGFDHFPPSLLNLIGCLRAAGSCCEYLYADAVAAQITCFAAQDSSKEIESVARWVRRLLERGADSIGVVVPDLHMCRSQIERTFRQQIDPDTSISFNDDEAVFSLSLGGVLAEQGVICAALESLGLRRQVTLEQISFLLRTPYLGRAGQEADGRARLDKKLRSFRQQSFTLQGLISLLENKPDVTGFLKILKIAQKGQQVNDMALPGVWAECFAEELHVLGWPGDRPLLSGEYQAIKAWQDKVLSVLVSLDPVLPEINRQRAISLLRRISNDMEFQLEGSIGSVQVVGLLESAGLNFDHLWVMGMGETVLPARPQPNPFIPLKLQQLHDMPHCSSARELQFSEHIVARLKTASPEIVFSYPRRSGDCDLRPSPLIPLDSAETSPDLADFHDLSFVMQSAPDGLEKIKDWCGPQLVEPLVKGGTSLLKDQAHCPFRAFVHHRLQAQGFSESTPGIAPMIRGDLVHLALEKIWKQLQNQTDLLELSELQRIGLVQSQVAEVFKIYFKNRSAPQEQLLKLEIERVTILINEWLDRVEINRDSFQVVETERQYMEKIGSLQIQFQVDRIDQLENGQRIIIDYKTGSSLHAGDLLSNPLIEPQLPIYAVADSQSVVDGVVFAKVRRGECRFVGLVKEKGLLGRVRELSSYSSAEESGITDWQQLLIFWRNQLDQLAADFAAGEAVVRPYDSVKSCQYCDLSGLCRIQESAAEVGIKDDD